MVSICTGAFILTATGALDGRRATTHWQQAERLQRSYPGVAVDEDAIFIQDETVYTSAGVTAGIDLALALVEEDHGPELARAVARSLVVHMRRAGGQSQFSTPQRERNASSARLRDVVASIESDPAAPHTVARLARDAGLSERHLTRLFRRETGVTPSKHLEAVRLDRARVLLDAGATIGDAAHEAGFGSTETLRRAFASRLGVTPSEYRRRFRSARPTG